MSQPGPLEREIGDRLAKTITGLEGYEHIAATGQPPDGMDLTETFVAILRDLSALGDSVVQLAAEIDRLKADSDSAQDPS
jgi:hypothetical protein